ncbi:MAG: fumarylacetoacetase [Acidimicrobiia bacterium]|nr:fumarylacetoacetase [Acidimicrobiia bacterium]MDH3471333.1 fumarylacetoacetase [Acidimicrobiia bacterium]
MTDHTVDPELGSWLPVPVGSDFPIQNLPFGVFHQVGDTPRMGVAIGNRILDLDIIAEAGLFDGHVELDWGFFASDSINPLLAKGPETWRAVRERVSDLLSFENREIRDTWGLAEKALVPMPEAQMLLPVAIGDFVDFFSSVEHATNLGKLFRPDGEPLLQNWRYLPVGYHGRSATVVVSGTPVVRPRGQVKPKEGPPQWIASRKLDFELELGFIVGPGNELGSRIKTEDAAEHVFGVVLVNDWSARDIQQWESQPLGPFLGKSFATSISSWVVPMDALAPYRVPSPEQEPPVQYYLVTEGDWGLDMNLEVAITTRDQLEHEQEPNVVAVANARDIYWTMPQQLAHVTVNGAVTRPGDLFATGTISGAEPGSQGSMIELTLNGDHPLKLADGTERTFIRDGDTVVMRGWAGGDGRPRIGFGEVRGTVFPAEEG